MREERSSDWPTSRCLRTLRPLKSKISALRTHCSTTEVHNNNNNISLLKVYSRDASDDYDPESDSDTDVSMDRSLNLEEHVLPFKKSKTCYKRRKVTIMDDPTYNDGIGTQFNSKMNQDDLQVSSITHTLNDMAWRLLDDVLETFKQLFIQHWDRGVRTRLRLLCAFKLGVSIGKIDKDIKNLQQQLIGSHDATEPYDYPHVELCRKWVMLGHALGLLISQCPLVEEVLDHLIQWSREHGLHHTLFQIFIESREGCCLEKYDQLKGIADSTGYMKLDEVILKKIAMSTDPLSINHQNVVISLILKSHGYFYAECLTIMAKLVDTKCEQMANTHSLVETIHSIQREQLEIIELISLFAQILHPKHPLNIEFLKSCFHSCKRGYRSLIPSLRVFKSFLLQLAYTRPSLTSSCPLISASNMVVLRTIFKQEYTITRYFVRYIESVDNHSVLRPKSINSATTPTHKRSKVSTGDLI